MKRALVLTSGLAATMLALAACSGGSGSDSAALNVDTVPDKLFAAGVECRGSNLSEYKVWETPYKEFTCASGPSGTGSRVIHVQVFGSADVFDAALKDLCGGKQTTSSGTMPPFMAYSVITGGNWAAWTESSDEASLPAAQEALMKALGGSAISWDDTCSRVGGA